MLEPEKVRLSLGDFIAKAVATALVRHPVAQRHVQRRRRVTRYGDVNLGMAVAVPDGLIVPVLRNINQMGLKEIRQRSVDLIDRARAEKLEAGRDAGGTFTVSNLGTYGIREFSAIINPPEVGILAVAAAEKRAVVRDDQIVARTMMTAHAVRRPPRCRRRHRRRIPADAQGAAGRAGDDAGLVCLPAL